MMLICNKYHRLVQIFVFSWPYNDINTRDVNVISTLRRRKKLHTNSIVPEET